MHDLTKGPITRHLLGMAAFIGVGLLFQTLYYIVDLYFVSHLGKAAIAGVSSAGVASFVVMAASQLVAVGSLALISQAVGRKDEADANLVLNQSLGLSAVLAAITLVAGYALAPLALAGIAADAATAEAGTRYLYAFLPSLALMFPMAALGSALRASGVVKPTMVLQTLSVLLNVVLAPVLIAGWGTGAPLGVTGAGLASSIAVAVTVVALVVIFPRVQSYLRVTASGWTPRLSVWGRIIGIGLPAAGEFFIMFLVFGVVYAVIRRFGPEAQAGFGIGSRVMMSIFLPAMAIAFAAAPIAGQNYGAGLADRVRHTFRQAALIGSGIMVVLTLLCHLRPDLLVAPFTNDAKVAETAATYLKIISWNFVATGLVFACSGLFQALGDTRPAFFSSLTRLLTFAIPAIWLSYQPWATLEHVWYVSLSSVLLQAVVSLLLLHALMAKKLAKPAPDLTKAPAPAV